MKAGDAPPQTEPVGDGLVPSRAVRTEALRKRGAGEDSLGPTMSPECNLTSRSPAIPAMDLLANSPA